MAGGWSDPEPHFRFWTWLGGPVFLATVLSVRRQSNAWLWALVVSVWGGLWYLSSCAPVPPSHTDCHQSLAHAWMWQPLVSVLYAGFPLAVTLAAIASLLSRMRTGQPHHPETTA